MLKSSIKQLTQGLYFSKYAKSYRGQLKFKKMVTCFGLKNWKEEKIEFLPTFMTMSKLTDSWGKFSINKKGRGTGNTKR